MTIQDKVERILRELHIMISRAPAIEEDGDFVLIHKKNMQRLLNAFSQTVNEMMEQYEATAESRNKAELEAEKYRMDIMRNANHQAEDIYAASVIYSDDALGRIQDIIEEAEKSTRKILNEMNRSMEKEKRQIRSNQVELKTQLEDMKDTAKYIKIIEERNRETARAKAKKLEAGKPAKLKQKVENEVSKELIADVPKELTADIPESIIEELTADISESVTEEITEEIAEVYSEDIPEIIPENLEEEPVVYEKPVIKINEEYFEKAGLISKDQELDENVEIEEFQTMEQKKPEQKEKRHGLFSFGKKG